MKFFKFFTALLVLALSSQSQADIDNVSSAPSAVSVPVKGAANLNITWQVRRSDPAGGGASVTVSSSEALLQLNGRAIATIGSRLSKPSTLALGQSGTLTFQETLALSPSLTRKIANAPAGSVRIFRQFTDTQNIGSGTVNVSTGTSTGVLSVRRIELSFENNARTNVVRKGSNLRAVADVSFRSNGLLRGEWRLVSQTSATGETRGRVLQVVQQQLISAGEGRQKIISPPLPTNMYGLYMLSFYVEGESAQTTPILRYFVLAGRNNTPPINMAALTPGNGTSVHQDTVFSWAALPRAQAYQLELLNTISGKVVAAKLVPATDLKLSLSLLSLEDLAPASTYNWRLKAFANGKVIGQSETYRLRTE